MIPTFNLITEPWIPIVWSDGRTGETGLLDILVHAHEIHEIIDPSPLITASLHRLLLALVHRVSGPKTSAEWEPSLATGRFPEQQFSQYFEAHSNRFELFSSTSPFYQSTSPEVLNDRPQAIAVIVHELASGNNNTLFDHPPNSGLMISHAEAARLIVTIQNYGLGGLAGPGKDNYIQGRLVSGVLSFVHGPSLFHTLWLNALPYNFEEPIPGGPEDRPVWEQESETRMANRVPFGYLDYLTWQSRHLSLVPAPHGVSQVKMLKGTSLDDNTLRDPMMAIHTKNDKTGLVTLRLAKDRAVWRDAHVFLVRGSSLHTPPAVVDFLAQRQQSLCEAGISPALHLYGLSCETGKAAKVVFWRHERMPLPLSILKEEALSWDVEEMTTIAEAAGRACGSALWELARALLAPNIGMAEGRSPDKEAVRNLCDSFPSLRHYWASLENLFHEHLTQLSAAPEGTLESWRRTVHAAAWGALRTTTNSLDGSSRALKATVTAQDALSRHLHKNIPLQREVTEGATTDA